MAKIFRIDSPFTEAMTKMFDLIALNVMFLLCCLPVVSIGASCTALHTITMKIAAGDEPPILKSFFRAFRDNWKQATLTWFLLLAAGVFLYVDSRIANQLGTGGLPMKILLGFLSILYLFVLLYIFQIQGRYQNATLKNLQNALLMAIRQLPKTVLLAGTIILPVLIALYGPPSVFLICIVCFLLVGCSLIACIQDRIVIKIFDYYEQLTEEATTEGDNTQD